MVNAEHPQDALARLARSLGFWQQRGFVYTPLPWIADPAYTEATRPPHGVAQPDLCGHGSLLASGEQAFIMLAHQGRLPAGESFVGWTPCFRREFPFDATHHLYFLKAELFVPVSADTAAQVVATLVEGSLAWFKSELAGSGELRTVQVSPEQVDIELNGLEVGSYGWRSVAGVTFAYGTACAEPRFSQARARARMAAE